MAKPAFRSLTPLMILVFAGGCTATVDNPSLAPRAVERFTVAEPVPAPPPPAALPEDASRQERASALTARAREADHRFRTSLGEAETAVSRGAGAAPGSEAWVQAQQALSRAEVLREPVSGALAELDALQIASAETGVGTEAEAALTASLQEVITIDTREREAITALSARIALP